MSATTTRQIAAAVGISQPSLYAHFPTREAIGVELCCRAFNLLYQKLAADMRDETGFAQRYLRLGRRYIDFGLENPSAYRVAFLAPMPVAEGPDHERVKAAGQQAFGVLRSLMSEVESDPLSAEVAAQTNWANLHGLVALLLDRDEFGFADRELLIDRMLKQSLAGTLALAGKPSILPFEFSHSKWSSPRA